MPEETILLVEDSVDDIEAARRALYRARIVNPVQVVTGAGEAMSYLMGLGIFQDRKLHPFPALLLLDLKLPGRSGFEVLRWLTEEPRFKPKAVVVLAGLTDLPNIRRAYELGANSFLTKPLVVEELLNSVRRLRTLAVSEVAEGFRVDAR